MSKHAIRQLALPVLILVACISMLAQQATIRAQIDLVVVPASVRDADGKLVYDLKKEDFTVFEDGRPQEVRTLSVDAAPLSVAVLIDTGVGGSALDRVGRAIVSLSSSFTDADEAEIYRFDHIAAKLSEFTSSQEQLERNLTVIKKMAEGRPNRPTALFLFPGRGPRWLRWLFDSGVEYKSLNDPLFSAAIDLEGRPAEHRKVIMIISDGQVANPTTLPFQKGAEVHSLNETQERLVQRQIQVYGVAVGNALLEGPTSILHAYADATGGDVYRAPTQNSIEAAFPRITEQARHQYVLSYISNNEIPGLLPVNRKIEVRVNRPNLKVSHRQRYLQYPSK